MDGKSSGCEYCMYFSKSDNLTVAGAVLAWKIMDRRGRVEGEEGDGQSGSMFLYCIFVNPPCKLGAMSRAFSSKDT